MQMKFKILSYIHIIYYLNCPCCLVYVGQSKRPLKPTTAEHQSAVSSENLVMARHYVNANHGSASRLEILGYFTCQQKGHCKLLRRKKY